MPRRRLPILCCIYHATALSQRENPGMPLYKLIFYQVVAGIQCSQPRLKCHKYMTFPCHEWHNRHNSATRKRVTSPAFSYPACVRDNDPHNTGDRYASKDIFLAADNCQVTVDRSTAWLVSVSGRGRLYGRLNEQIYNRRVNQLGLST